MTCSFTKIVTAIHFDLGFLSGLRYDGCSASGGERHMVGDGNPVDPGRFVAISQSPLSHPQPPNALSQNHGCIACVCLVHLNNNNTVDSYRLLLRALKNGTASH